ncbi:hypothetical protein AVEN_159162-1 [Araneus ventricosus]|uniref:Uncharacterized protein n=1 Tax=Araneus ventricosus TaxID=182803 RepID=A0A4Y2LGL1_ARAVE|nr:hypothetical protein AVEN_159162-1 [Araneus ventricosus]
MDYRMDVIRVAKRLCLRPPLLAAVKERKVHNENASHGSEMDYRMDVIRVAKRLCLRPPLRAAVKERRVRNENASCSERTEGRQRMPHMSEMDSMDVIRDQETVFKGLLYMQQ